MLDFYEQYIVSQGKRVVRWAMRNLNVDSDDFEQDCLTRALEKWDQYSSDRSGFRTWFSWQARRVRSEHIAKLIERYKYEAEPLQTYEQDSDLTEPIDVQILGDYLVELRNNPTRTNKRKYDVLACMEDYLRTFGLYPSRVRIAELMGLAIYDVENTLKAVRADLKERL